MSRNDTRNIENFFGGPAVIEHVTGGANATLAVGPIDLLQVQIDTTLSDVGSSLQLQDGGTVFKRVSLAGIGGRDVSFLGRPYRVTNHLYLTRPEGDTHLLHFTLIYKQVLE